MLITDLLCYLFQFFSPEQLCILRLISKLFNSIILSSGRISLRITNGLYCSLLKSGFKYKRVILLYNDINICKNISQCTINTIELHGSVLSPLDLSNIPNVLFNDFWINEDYLIMGNNKSITFNKIYIENIIRILPKIEKIERVEITNISKPSFVTWNPSTNPTNKITVSNFIIETIKNSESRKRMENFLLQYLEIDNITFKRSIDNFTLTLDEICKTKKITILLNRKNEDKSSKSVTIIISYNIDNLYIIDQFSRYDICLTFNNKACINNLFVKCRSIEFRENGAISNLTLNGKLYQSFKSLEKM